jgi:putative acetyltransferase
VAGFRAPVSEIGGRPTRCSHTAGASAVTTASTPLAPLGSRLRSNVSSIRDARPDEVELVRALFREYAASLGRDLSFQDFERELTELPDFYRVILLAEEESEVVGCAAVRGFAPGVAELKRLYVRPEARGAGLGRALSIEAIERARVAGFTSIRLDTLPTMAAATALYRDLGFREIEPYRHNPIPGTRYFELEL